MINDVSDRPLKLHGWDLVLILGLSLGAIHLSPLLVYPLIAGLVRALGKQAMAVMVVSSMALQAVGMVAVVYLIAVRWRGVPWSALGATMPPRRWWFRAIAMAVLALFLVAGVNVVVALLLGELPLNPQISMIAPAGFSWFGLLSVLIMAAVVAPIAEELVFRGVIYRWMRIRWGFPIGVTLSALCFSTLHGIPWLIPALTAVGMLLALIYERSGSLWPAVVTHGLFNAINTVLIYVALSQGWVVATYSEVIRP
jgi:membrane protease YdiL (CAAX protease family)